MVDARRATLEDHLGRLLACALKDAYHHVLEFRVLDGQETSGCITVLQAQFLVDKGFPKEGSAKLTILRLPTPDYFDKVLVTIPKRRNGNEREVATARKKAQRLLYGDLLADELRSAAIERNGEGSRLSVLDNLRVRTDAVVGNEDTWLATDTRPQPFDFEHAYIVLKVHASSSEFHLPLCWSLDGYLGGPKRTKTNATHACPELPSITLRNTATLSLSNCSFSIAWVEP